MARSVRMRTESLYRTAAGYLPDHLEVTDEITACRRRNAGGHCHLVGTTCHFAKPRRRAKGNDGKIDIGLEGPCSTPSQRETKHGRSMGQHAQSGCDQSEHSRICEGTAVHRMGKKQ